MGVEGKELPFVKIRTEEEVVWAHDLIASMIKLTGFADPIEDHLLRQILGVLCWVLQDNASEALDEVINGLLDRLTRGGYVFSPRPVPLKKSGTTLN